MDNLLGLIAILLSTVLLTYLTGTIFLRFGNNKFSFSNLFFKVVFGAFAITICYALIKSRFTSVYTVILPPLFYYFFKIRKDALKHFTNPIRISRETVLKEILTLTGLSCVSFLILGLYTINKEDFSVSLAYYDFHFYSEIARGLLMNGQENFNVRFFPLYESQGIALYHYFDLWMTALLAEATGINTFSLLMTVVYPLFFMLTVLGIMSVFQNRINKSIANIIISLLVTSSFSFESRLFMESELLYIHNISTPASYLGMKLLYTYPLFIFALHKFIRKDINAAILILLTLSILYNTLLVAVISALFVLAVFIYLKSKKTDAFILLGLTVTGLLSFTYLIGIHSDAITGTGSTVANPKTSLIIFIETVYKYSVAYLPALILLILAIVRKKTVVLKENKELFIFSLISFLASAAFLSIFHRFENYSQALSNFIPGLFLVLLVFAIMQVGINIKMYAFLTLFALLNVFAYSKKQLNFNNLYSKEYRETCLNVISESKNKRFLLYNELRGDNGKSWKYNFYELARFTSFLKKVPSGINIAYDFEPLLSEYVSPSPFGIWCKQNDLPIDENSLINYMDQNEIGFIFINKLTPFSFDFEDNFSTIYEDPISNEVLLMRKI